MSSTVADPVADQEQARARLAAKAERARVAATAGVSVDKQTVADIDRLPELAEQIEGGESRLAALYAERDAAILRLMTRAKAVGPPSHLSHAVVGFLAGGSKSLPGRVLLHRDT